MDELKKLVVEHLVKETDHNKQIRILQEINEMLLTKYCIKVSGSIEIRPLRVEAYYFHPGKFEDSTVHGSPQQRKSEVLYRHNPKEDIDLEKDNGGVDLCLAYDKEGVAPYFLSFLLKNSWIKTSNYKGHYCKQIELNKILNENGIKDDTKINLEPRINDSEEDLMVFHTVRKGLSGKPFGREPLASLIGINRKAPDDNSKPFFDFAPGCGKEQILAEYLWTHPEENNKENWEKWYGRANEPMWQKNIKKLTDELTKNKNQ